MDQAIAPQRLAYESLRSLYPADVAKVFSWTGLQVVRELDPDLLDPVERVNAALIATVPYIDISVPNSREIDPVKLDRAYELEQDAKTARHARFDEIIQGLVEEPPVMRRALDHMVNLGVLIKGASPFAHDNMIDRLRPKRDEAFAGYSPEDDGIPNLSGGIPRSLEQQIAKMIDRGFIPKTAEAIRNAIAATAYSIVLSAHPTRYLLPEYTGIRGQFFFHARKLTCPETGPDGLLQLMQGKGEAYETLRKFWQTTPTPTTKDGGPANFKPSGEIDYTLSYVRDLFTRQIDNTYRKFDNAQLRLLGNDEYDDEAKLHFVYNLMIRLWTIVDKDGNNNLFSEHFSPLCILMFQQMGAELYAAQLRAMEAQGLVLEGAPDGGKWSNYLESKRAEMGGLLVPLVERISSQGGDMDLPLSREEFLARLDALNKLYGGPNGINRVDAQLQSALETAYRQSEGEAKNLSLSLLRKSRMLGLGLVKYHFRETSIEYGPVVANLVRQNPFDPADTSFDYNALSREDKIQFLNRMMTEKSPEELAAYKDTFMERFKEGGTLHLREYDEKNPDVITLHTVQRFEGGAREEGLVTDHVNADCEGALHIMETLFLCRMTGLKPIIAPLLENHETLTSAPEIFRESYGNRAYRDYMWEMTGRDPTKLIKMLKVVWAHSDNMRLMGQPAARANIYEEVHKLPGEMKRFFPELLDMYIADGRIAADEKADIIARTDADPSGYDVMQFHGGSKCDAPRGGVRSTYGFCDDLGAHRFFEETMQGGCFSELSEGERAERLITTLIAHNAQRVLEIQNGQGKVWNTRREQAIRKVIDKSIKRYEDNHYETMLGVALGEAGGYAHDKAINNPGSRGERTSTGVNMTCRPGDLGPVDPSKIRTISLTTAAEDMGVVVSPLPMREAIKDFNELYANDDWLREDLAEDSVAVFGQRVEVFKNGALTIEGWQTLYLASPTFRASPIDFPAFGVARGDPQLTMDLLKQREGRGSKPASPAVLDYFDHSIPKDFIEAGILGLKSVGYDAVPSGFISPEELANPTADTCSRMTFLVRRLVLPHLEEQISLGEHLHHLGRVVREALVAKGIRDGNEPFDNDAAYMIRQTGILRQLYSHVFYDGAFDRPVAIARRQECRREPVQQELRAA